jgi:superfamily II DNA or RNA helicase
MTTPSSEQEYIISQVLNNNIIIDCVAGSGKSSSVLFIAKQYPNLNILALTYNAQLKNETRKKTKDLKNLTIHSYHSFCTTFYDKSAYTDHVMNEVINTNRQPVNIINYDIIIADEAQDITPLFYRLLGKIFIS